MEDFGKALGLTRPGGASRYRPGAGLGPHAHQALRGLAEALEQAPKSPVRAPLEVLAPRRERNACSLRPGTPPREALSARPVRAPAVRTAGGHPTRTPCATRLRSEDERLSYGELNARANRLAHHLIAQGVGPDDRVAICLERCIEMVVWPLRRPQGRGSLRVPLDPAYPAERLAFMLQDCAPAIVLSHGPSLAPPWSAALAGLASAPIVIDLDADQARWARRSKADPDPTTLGLTPRNLAYVIYTLLRLYRYPQGRHGRAQGGGDHLGGRSGWRCSTSSADDAVFWQCLPRQASMHLAVRNRDGPRSWGRLHPTSE